ncbi:response regulator [bacterium]|nr:response regulator [bacterium]
MPKTKILVVEDDRSLANVLEYNLTNSGYEVFCAHDGQDGLNQARAKTPDMIILDVMIPVIDGVETCRQLRAEQATRETPIMMLTAKSEETDQLIGFSVGADDYVVKPFSVRVLLERIKSLLRRRERDAGGADVVAIGTVSVDRIKHRASVNDKPMDLTPSEFRLLDTMIRQPGRAFDRTELIDLALGADTMVLERTIDVHIRSLRKKMGDSAGVVETVRGVGYRFGDNRETPE